MRVTISVRSWGIEMCKLCEIADRFGKNESGATAILFGLCCIFLFGIVGLSIDTSRYYNYTSRLQSALDAAALSGARLLPDESASNTDIQTLVVANFMAAMENSGVKADKLSPPTVLVDRVANSVAVQGRASLPVMFSAVLGGSNSTEIVRTSRVVYDMKEIELSLVLDITGSMNSQNKLNDMKTAAKDIVDELFSGSLSENSVRIALAPYSASVNAGSLAGTVSDMTSATSCSWNHYRWSCYDSAGTVLDTCVIERRGFNAGTDAAPVGLDKLPRVPSLPYGNYTCPSSTVLPLKGKSQKDMVKASIDSYSASGATAGHIGSAWGWYLISPEWASVLPDGSKPEPYSNGVDKSVIIMTDGEFNTSYLTGGETANATQIDESYTQFDTLCDGMKAKGITVYTVGFDLSSTRALSELEKCASTPENFFDAKTGAQLKKAFKDIARKLNTLRVAS